MILEVQILKNKVILNSSDPNLSLKILDLLKRFGIDVDVLIPDSRCG